MREFRIQLYAADEPYKANVMPVFQLTKGGRGCRCCARRWRACTKEDALSKQPR